MQCYIQTDQGGKLARSAEFHTIVAKHGYVVEPTGPTLLPPRMAEVNAHIARLPTWYAVCYTELAAGQNSGQTSSSMQVTYTTEPTMQPSARPHMKPGLAHRFHGKLKPNDIEVEYNKSKDQPADFLMKSLRTIAFEYNRLLNCG
jgi:hypothetical protein